MVEQVARRENPWACALDAFYERYKLDEPYTYKATCAGLSGNTLSLEATTAG